MQENPVPFLNIEYFFRLLYESRLQFAEDGDVIGAFNAWVAHAWGVLGVVSFLFVVAAFFVLAYASMRLYQIKKFEGETKYSTIKPEAEEKRKDHSRWAHIQTLIESATPSDWRQAIIEADIMLEEVLMQAGYPGESVGDRLKMARFQTLDDAWEAHKVRNEIAHQGSTYHLDDKTAFRAIKRYEAVFKEFGEI
ncbi:MAG TPA: hypothetical protein VEB18_01990 [Candidatus Paceibacterota bacterium]|nr:hypothetical protein [Candidatus Paceibacterota bacterium]